MFRVGRVLAVAMALLVATLAGCVAPAAKSDAPAAEGSSPSAFVAVQAAVPLDSSSTALSDWAIVTANASPQGGLAAFWWTIPEGAPVPWSYNEDFGTDSTVVALEVAPIVPADKLDSVRGWGLVSFEEESGALSAGGGFLSVESRIRSAAPFWEPVDEVESVALEPRFVTFARDVAAGERLALLLVVVADEEFEFSLAWRVLDHDPGDGAAAASADAFVANRTGSAMRLPQVDGTGFSASAYQHIAYSAEVPGPVHRVEVWVGEGTGIRNGKQADVSLSAHTLNAVAPGALSSGWAAAGADYIGFGLGATAWDVEASAHGVSRQGRGVAAELSVVPFVPLVAVASAAVLQEGEGGAEAVLEHQSVTAMTWLNFASVSVVELGATLEALYGVPAETFAGVTDSTLPAGEVAPQDVFSGWMRTPALDALQVALAASAAKAS